MNNILKDFTTDDVESVVSLLSNAITERLPVLKKQALIRVRKILNANEAKLFDLVISIALTSKFVSLYTKFNSNVVLSSDIELAGLYIDSVLNKRDCTLKTHSLPFQVQLLLKFCNFKTYKLPTRLLRECIQEVVIKLDSISNPCKRCYSELDLNTENVICNVCFDKIKSCTDYVSDSFSIHGTTIEPFKVRFKNWDVDVKHNGEYIFTAEDKSDVQYQQNLPFKEYQKFLVIIG